MSVTPHPPRSFPAVTQSMPTHDTSLSNSDRSLRSMHSAPSLTSAGSTSFASSVLSTSTLNLNVHSIPLRHPHLHIVDENGDEHDQQLDDNKENLHGSFAPPDITITSSPERPQIKRMQSEKTVAGSLRLPRRSQGSLDSDAHLSWRTSEYGVLSDAYEEDEAIGSDGESVSGSTDELRRTLFYRPSTDPIQVRFQTEDRELEAALSAGSTSNTSLPQSTEPATDLENRPVHPEFQPESKPSSPPTRPARPPSLNLSDTQEPKPAPKSVDVDSIRRRSMQQAQAHSRKSSRDRLSMLLGLNTASPRTSLQGGRLSFQLHNPSQSHSSNDTGKSQPENEGREAIRKGKERMVESESPISDTWVHVGAGSTTELSSVGMRSALELGNGGGVGTSSAIDLAASASGSRPRARTFSTHSRARTISSTHSQNAAEMCRSVWEDDTEDFGKGWGLVKRWLGEDAGGSSSTPGQKKRHVPKSLSLASTINAFRTPTSISSTINAFRTPTTMSPLFGEGGLMGGDPNASFATAKESLSSALTGDGYATPRSAMTTHETATSRLSFHSFSNTSKRTSRSGLPSASGSNESGERTPASLTVPAPYTGRPSSRASVDTSSDGHSAPEPESPTVTAKRLRPRSGTLEVPELPAKSSRALFVESGSGLRLELKPGTSKPGQQDFLRPGSYITQSALPSPPSSPDDLLQNAQSSSFHPAATSTVRTRAPIPRSLNSTTFGSLHSRLGSPLRSGTGGEEGWAPMSPFTSPHSSPQTAGPQSPGWSPISPLPSSPLRTPASPLLSPTGSFGAGPPSPRGMGIPMEHIYRSDVRPISGYTESSYRPSFSKRDSSATGGTGWKRDSATAGKRESDGTFAGRHSITHQPLLAPPPRTKTVRIVEAGPSTEARVRSIRETRATLPPIHPSAPIPTPRAGAIFKINPNSGAHTGPRMRVKRKEAVGAGPSARVWFLIGFILGPWCWVVGGWMVQQGRPMATLDVEKGGRAFEGAQWVRRCRIASIVSGAVVFSGALVAVVWAAIGAR
ncbi:unnamed protein product [Rhizoctonia solani]|uniref:Uncharacterized protein n=1 Tax=Rhizoctonia solani TaxID=456999 RepID=A0A8H3DN95_9AGAM|nr:unnamed protein product [Rhizoctonia solani]